MDLNHRIQVCGFLDEHLFAPRRARWSQPTVTLRPNLAYDAWRLT